MFVFPVRKRAAKLQPFLLSPNVFQIIFKKYFNRIFGGDIAQRTGRQKYNSFWNYQMFFKKLFGDYFNRCGVVYADV